MEQVFLGDYVRQRREDLGLTQGQLCEGICEPITISRKSIRPRRVETLLYEEETTMKKTKKLLALALALMLSLSCMAMPAMAHGDGDEGIMPLGMQAFCARCNSVSTRRGRMLLSKGFRGSFRWIQHTTARFLCTYRLVLAKNN